VTAAAIGRKSPACNIQPLTWFASLFISAPNYRNAQECHTKQDLAKKHSRLHEATDELLLLVLLHIFAMLLVVNVAEKNRRFLFPKTPVLRVVVVC